MKIKQGNDIKVSVPVHRVNGEQSVAENMETAQNIVLLLCSKNFRSVVHQITDYTVSDNVISFVVGKSMQSVLGTYRVELRYYQADPTQEDGLQTFSADKEVYELVEFTSETDTSQVGDVTVTSVEIALGVQAGINGLSAYDIAVTNGYVGSVAEWLLSLKGEKGDKGDQGIQGIQGIKGDKGDVGPQGIQGERGLQGEQGIQGIQGLKGDKGDTGEKGLDGVQLGETSTTAYAGDKGKKLATDLIQLSSDLNYIILNQVKGFRITEGIYKRTDNSSSLLIDVKDAYNVSFVPGVNTSYYLFVKSYTEQDTVPDYATGSSGYGVAVTNARVDVPTDAKYLIVLANVGGTSDRTPNSILVDGITLTNQLTKAALNSSKSSNNKDKRELKNIMLTYQTDIDDINHKIGVFDYSTKGFRITNSKYERADNSSSLLIDISTIKSVAFIPSASTSYYLFVKSYTEQDTVPDYATGSSGYGVAVTNARVDVPTDAKYLIVLANVGGTSDRTPQSILADGHFEIRSSIYDNFNAELDSANNKIDNANALINNINNEILDIKTDSSSKLIADNSGYADGSIKWKSIGDSYTEINNTLDSTIRARIIKGYQDRIIEKIPQLLCTNDGHSGETFISYWNNYQSAFVGGYDIYTIMLGTNDWSLSANWGTLSDFTSRNSSTSLGCFGLMIDKIKSVAPTAKIIVATQFHRGVGIVPSGTIIAARNHDTYQPNTLGKYLADMEDDIITCCKSENIEYVDIFNESGVTPKNACKFAKVQKDSVWQYLRYPDFLSYIVYDVETQNPYDETTLWTTYDGVHPSHVGMQIIANLLGNKIIDLLFK